MVFRVDPVFSYADLLIVHSTIQNPKELARQGEYEESVWERSAGTTSAPFAAAEHRQIAVKVIDDRGNELMVVERTDGKFKIQNAQDLKFKIQEERARHEMRAL